MGLRDQVAVELEEEGASYILRFLVWTDAYKYIINTIKISVSVMEAVGWS